MSFHLPSYSALSLYYSSRNQYLNCDSLNSSQTPSDLHVLKHFTNFFSANETIREIYFQILHYAKPGFSEYIIFFNPLNSLLGNLVYTILSIISEIYSILIPPFTSHIIIDNSFQLCALVFKNKYRGTTEMSLVIFKHKVNLKKSTETKK